MYFQILALYIYNILVVPTIVISGTVLVGTKDFNGGKATDIVGSSNRLMLVHVNSTNLHCPLQSIISRCTFMF